MTRKVKISKTAQKRLDDLFDYLVTNWTLKVKSKFVLKLDKVIEIIRENPKSFPESRIQVGLHKCVVSKQISIFYTFTEFEVNIVGVFDNRQDPNKLPGELKG